MTTGPGSVWTECLEMPLHTVQFWVRDKGQGHCGTGKTMGCLKNEFGLGVKTYGTNYGRKKYSFQCVNGFAFYCCLLQTSFY